MTEEQAAVVSRETGKPVRWYSLNPKHLHFSKFTWYFMAIAAVVFLCTTINIKPIWNWEWRHYLICAGEFESITSTKGKKFKGGDWARSKRIIVYGAPGVDAGRVQLAFYGIRDMVKELKLDFTVELVACPAEAKGSIQKATRKKGEDIIFDYDRFLSDRLDDRGNQYGEMVVQPNTFLDPSWAWGLTNFNSGVSY